MKNPGLKCKMLSLTVFSSGKERYPTCEQCKWDGSMPHDEKALKIG